MHCKWTRHVETRTPRHQRLRTSNSTCRMSCRRTPEHRAVPRGSRRWRPRCALHSVLPRSLSSAGACTLSAISSHSETIISPRVAGDLVGCAYRIAPGGDGAGTGRCARICIEAGLDASAAGGAFQVRVGEDQDHRYGRCDGGCRLSSVFRVVLAAFGNGILCPSCKNGLWHEFISDLCRIWQDTGTETVNIVSGRINTRLTA